MGVRDTVLRLPPLAAMRRARFERRFFTPAGVGAYRGAFDRFDEAQRSVAHVPVVGYDTPDAAALYRDRLDRVYPADYPALYWLRRWLPANARVVDFGGHVGVSCLAFARFLDQPPARWTVCDVPAVTAAGAQLARERGVPALQFVTALTDAGAADLFLAAGSLQYVEPSLTTLLQQLPALPPAVVVNKLPTHPTRTFYTVQHLGMAYCPYRITRDGALANELARLGYVLEDQWENAELHCQVALDPAAGPITYRGYAFRRLERASAG